MNGLISTITSAISAVVSAVFATVSSAPANETIFYVLAAALMGGLVPALVGAYRRWKRGPIEDKEIIGRIVHNEMTDMKDLLAEYRTEVEVTKRQLEEYRVQLLDNTKELAKAQLRITQLEEALRISREDREKVVRELITLRGERDGLMSRRLELEAEVEHQRLRVDELERFAKRLHPDGPQAD